jgi:hypothetical protein
MYGPSLFAHIHSSANSFVFGDDARPCIVPFVVSDYGTEYHYSTTLPLGYKVFYHTLALVADPITVSKVLPYPLLLVVLGGVCAAAGQLGGVATAFSAAALCLSSGVFLNMMVAGCPRVFAFPCIAAAAVALVFGQTLWLAAIVVISAALYPPIAVVTGLALGFETLALSARHRGETREWPLNRRLLLVAATALGASLVLAPGLTAKGYGPRVTLHEVAAYPAGDTVGGTALPSTTF